MKTITILTVIAGTLLHFGAGAQVENFAAIKKMPPVRVLTLDGGGIRGVLEAYYLMQIEAAAGKPIYQLFDLISGTSTGGIIALGLSISNENGEPSISADALFELYTKRGRSIFERSWSFYGLFSAKYRAKSLEAELKAYFGETSLRNALTHVLVTAYSSNHESGVLFSSAKAQDLPCFWDIPAWQVGRATSAAPTFFEPLEVEFPNGSGIVHNLVDGGLYRNNPSMLAYLEAKELYPNREIEVYSLGTGRAENPLRPGASNSTLALIKPVLHHMFVGVSQGDSDTLHRLLNNDGNQRYFRINTRLDAGRDGLDDVSAKNITYLTSKARQVVQTKQFRQMVSHLLGKKIETLNFPMRENGYDLVTMAEQPHEPWIVVPNVLTAG